ncbi:hypothetical protein MNEG_4344 [Monoraphidium neglectum]|uniref:HIRAN domain-containing protein n=1 Tax=Monoraphidium neglectum TaxID=145388 RepID=A0A0D2MT48_9CHLO|nr:hypothetical protein MNEG_4344 [Monoraphidium neglectum]KIZ03612.1 hypothetical protein MNEG_4344 [Monoraphidium neglectum]|eukprot:XP_013902631.1 hypothetical protein MNEG_4344 [Monoraphidium neglectum]
MTHALYLGRFKACAVGCKYDSIPGALAPSADATLVREPANPDDQNAVAVHNKLGDRVGYLPRELAALLAPLMDTGTLFVTAAAAPKSDPRTEDFASGYCIPLDINVYGCSAAAQEAWCALQHELQNFTPDSKLIKWGGNWWLNFGKYSGMKVADVALVDFDYIKWLLGEADLPQDVLHEISDVVFS